MGIKQLALWLPMIVLAFANAAIREMFFARHLSELRSQQLSTVTLTLLCSVYVWMVFPYLNIQNGRQAFGVGFVWVVLTIAFEFSIGRLTNKSWEYLFQNYNVLAGRIWSLFLACLFVLPYLVYLIRKS